MPNARGVVVLNAVRFVEAAYGSAAHHQVLAALPPAPRATFLTAIREASWEPLEHLVAYMETAHLLLAPSDPAFYRALGRFAGELERRETAYSVMVADPVRAMAMGDKVFRSIWDVGHLAVKRVSSREGIARILGFPSRRSLCERTAGAWEGLLSTDTLRCVVTEPVCMTRGDPFCEMRVCWVDLDSSHA